MSAMALFGGRRAQDKHRGDERNRCCWFGCRNSHPDPEQELLAEIDLRPHRAARRVCLRRRLDRRGRLLERGERGHHPLRWEGDDDFGSDAQLRLERKCPAVEIGEAFAIGRPRPAPCSADLIEFEPGRGAEASTIRDFLLGNAGPRVPTLICCPPDAVQPALSQISPPCGAEFDRIGQEVETNLADGAPRRPRASACRSRIPRGR